MFWGGGAVPPPLQCGNRDQKDAPPCSMELVDTQQLLDSFKKRSGLLRAPNMRLEHKASQFRGQAASDSGVEQSQGVKQESGGWQSITASS